MTRDGRPTSDGRDNEQQDALTQRKPGAIVLPNTTWVPADPEAYSGGRSMGDCTCSGGRYKRSYATVEGIDRIMPVDVYVPGCPPRPEGLIYGMLKLQQLVLERHGQWKDRKVGPTVPDGV